jgi:hypothetical protein
VRVGVLTYHRANNFGSALQTLGLQEALVKCGHEAAVLDYVAVKRWNDGWGWKDYARFAAFNPLNRVLQARKFSRFRAERMNLTRALWNVHDLEHEFVSYDVAMIGGDQVWNLKIRECGDPYFLKLNIPDRVRKVSYGSCFGSESVPTEARGTIGASLRDFDALSVRNGMSARLVTELSGLTPDLVVDPTFLISFEDIQVKSALGIGSIVFYCLLTPQAAMAAMRKALQERLAYPVLSTSSYSHFLGADKWAWGIGPGEWLSIFKNAEYIVTDSFHGTVFAIKNHKPFLTLAHPKTETRMRMVELLERYGLIDRLIAHPLEATPDRMCNEIDYDRVDAEIQRDVVSSYRFLEAALS